MQSWIKGNMLRDGFVFPYSAFSVELHHAQPIVFSSSPDYSPSPKKASMPDMLMSISQPQGPMKDSWGQWHWRGVNYPEIIFIIAQSQCIFVFYIKQGDKLQTQLKCIFINNGT